MGYAIIRTGGKQYRVKPGDSLRVERLEAPVGTTVKFTEVLAVHDDEGGLKLGTEAAGGGVPAQVVRHGRGKKITIWTFKRRKGYARKKGHRQAFTEVRILPPAPEAQSPRPAGQSTEP